VTKPKKNWLVQGEWNEEQCRASSASCSPIIEENCMTTVPFIKQGLFQTIFNLNSTKIFKNQDIL